MGARIGAGVVGGLFGGAVFDALMRVLPMATGRASMIAFAAEMVHAADPLAGFVVYPVYGVVIGGIFGAVVHRRPLADLRAALWGVLYAAGWWGAVELLVTPVLLSSWPFSLSVGVVWNSALPLLVGHVVYGAILGIVWRRLTGRPPGRHGERATAHTVQRAA